MENEVFKNKSQTGNNVCGLRVAELRKCSPEKMSQRALADRLQLLGVDVDKNAIQRIECGKRFVTDIELSALSKVFGVSGDYLLFGGDSSEKQ